jgi:drug/metabolite transporter (DMT)-like permease
VRLRGFIFILITACMFGLGTILAKVVGEAFNPFFVSWLALLCGGICVSTTQLIRRKPLVPRMTPASWCDLLLFASIGTALPLVCVVVGMAQTSAITGSFLLQLQGPAAIFCAVLFLKEKITWKQVGGIALLLVGSLLVILHDLHNPLQVMGEQGDLFVVVAALGLGFSYIPGKRLTENGDVLQVILLRLLVSSFLLLPLLAFQTNVLFVPLSWSLIGVLVLYIVTNFGVGYILQQAGLGLLQAWESAAIMQTLPLFSTIFALLLLHDSLTLQQLFGGCIILIGGFLIM